MSFTDQKSRIATEEDVHLKWGGSNPGERFRCYMCGHKFVVGDIWRWVLATHIGYLNFLVCEHCDGEDVLERWKKQNIEMQTRFWWIK